MPGPDQNYTDLKISLKRQLDYLGTNPGAILEILDNPVIIHLYQTSQDAFIAFEQSTSFVETISTRRAWIKADIALFESLRSWQFYINVDIKCSIDFMRTHLASFESPE